MIVVPAYQSSSTPEIVSDDYGMQTHRSGSPTGPEMSPSAVIDFKHIADAVQVVQIHEHESPSKTRLVSETIALQIDDMQRSGSPIKEAITCMPSVSHEGKSSTPEGPDGCEKPNTSAVRTEELGKTSAMDCYPTYGLTDLSNLETGSGQSSLDVGQRGSRPSTQATTPSPNRSLRAHDKGLALILYRPLQWNSQLSGKTTPTEVAAACGTDITTAHTSPFSGQELVTCNCRVSYVAELAGMRKELKEESKIELESQTEKLQEGYDEKIRRSKPELDYTISSRNYTRLLGRKKLHRAIDAKFKIEANLHATEGIVKAKDAVIEQVEATAAQLQRKVDALELERHTLTKNHDKIWSDIQAQVTAYVTDKEAEIQGLVHELDHLNPQSQGAEVPGDAEAELIKQFEHRPEDAILAYVNTRKELDSADRQVVDLQNQLNSFNRELEQDPARLAGVTRLLEFKDGCILELQRMAGVYHEELGQCQARYSREKKDSRASIELREAEIDLLQQEKADMQTRMQKFRQGWENAVQMFGEKVFEKDVTDSMNELYAGVKDDNAFLCQAVEAQQSHVLQLLAREKSLKMKLLDFEKIVKQSELNSRQLEEDVRAANYATENSKVEMDIRVDSLMKHIANNDITIISLNHKVENLIRLVDTTVRPGKASLELLKYKDAEIVALRQELQETSRRKEELEEAIARYDSLESWKNNFDKGEVQQEFVIRGLWEKVAQLEEQLRAARLASNTADFEAAQSILQEFDTMAEAWCAVRADCDRMKLRADHDNALFLNERVYFEASFGDARDTLMTVWSRYESLWNSLRSEGNVPRNDPVGPDEIADRVAQINENFDAQRAGNEALAEKSRAAATNSLRSGQPVRDPKPGYERYGDELVSAARVFLDQHSVLAAKTETGVNFAEDTTEAHPLAPNEEVSWRRSDISRHMVAQAEAGRSDMYDERARSAQAMSYSVEDTKMRLGADDIGLEQILIRDADFEPAAAKAGVQVLRDEVEAIYNPSLLCAEKLNNVYGPPDLEAVVQQVHHRSREGRASPSDEFRKASPRIWWEGSTLVKDV